MFFDQNHGYKHEHCTFILKQTYDCIFNLCEALCFLVDVMLKHMIRCLCRFAGLTSSEELPKNLQL